MFTTSLKGNDVKFNNEGTRIIDKLKVRVFQYQRKTDGNVNSYSNFVLHAIFNM